jgi:hypothetical protein
MSISINSMHGIRRAALFALAWTVWAGAAPALRAQSVSEPHTVFYGKVLGTASAQDFLITEGQLTWTMLRSDGIAVPLQTSLYPLHGGQYSYRLNVPHSAIALGLSTHAGGVPLPPVPQVNLHAEIKVDGQVATILGPAGSAFTTEQLLRTATHRLDLGLHRAATDTDGDGLPDWWEELHGLNIQDPTDAARDLSGDGLSVLEAYLRGLDPRRDARFPAVLTEEVIVYPSGSTAILLDTADLDSSPAQLLFTLVRPPHAGELVLRNAQAVPDSPDQVLAAGGTFAQADLLAGRLIYNHDSTGHAPGSFEVEVRDENPAHPPGASTVQLLSFEPAEQLPVSVIGVEAQRVEHYLDAESGAVVLDGTGFHTNLVLAAPSAGLDPSALAGYIAAYGPDRPYKILGASAATAVAAGGHRDDILMAGIRGGTLIGGPGADWFVAQSFDTGRITIADFNTAELDVLDLSKMPVRHGAYAHLYFRVVQTAGVYQIQTDLDGTGAGFTNLMVALPGLDPAEANLYHLIGSGRLRVGSLVLEPMISVVASQPQASENGAAPGLFTVTRQGSLDGDLVVNLSLSGSAQNGVDYQLVPATVLMPAGAGTVEIPILPYADGIPEPTEAVLLGVAAGAGYRVGSPAQATVTIEDLLMQVAIRAIEPVASKDTGSPGLFEISRKDVTHRDVVIRLAIGGTAANGSDYNTLSTLVYLAPNQTVAFLQVVPKPGAVLTGGSETVDITILSDANYRVGADGQARVVIIERADSFAGWRAREFPDVPGSAAAFAAADEGNTGIPHFRRYAFGLDPLQPDPGGLPRLFRQDGRVGVTFRKPPGITDVQYRVLATTDLLSWTAGAVPVVSMPAPAGESDPARVYYEALVGDAVNAFFGVEVEWVP